MLMRQDFTSSPFLHQFMCWTVLSILAGVGNISHHGPSPQTPFPTFCKAHVGVLMVVPTLAAPLLSTITNSRSVAPRNPTTTSCLSLCPTVCALLVWSIWYPYSLYFALGLGCYVSDIGCLFSFFHHVGCAPSSHNPFLYTLSRRRDPR